MEEANEGCEIGEIINTNLVTGTRNLKTIMWEIASLKVKKWFQFCLLSLLALTGCTYTLKDKYINPIQPPPANSGDYVSVDINQFGNGAPDVFQMVWYTYFYFSLQGPNQRLNYFSVKIDGAEIKNGSAGYQLDFQIDPASLTDGNHTVEVDMIVDTGTKSLANLLGEEYYTIKKTFTIVVDKVPPAPITSLTLGIENGLLTMKWDKISKTNFTLHVQRTYWNGNSDINLTDTTIASTATSFVDPGYVGGKVTYGIDAMGVGFDVVGYANFNLDPIDPVISQTNHITQISWGQPVVVGNASTITVAGSSGAKNNYSLTPSTVAADTLFLGGSVTETVTINSHKTALQNYVKTVSMNSSSNIKPFTQIFSIPSSGKFIIVPQSVYPYNLYRYSYSNFAKEDSSNYYATQMVFSNNGAYGVIESGVGPKSINPLNFSQISSLPSSITSTEAPNLYSISNTGLLTFNYYTNNAGPYYTSVTDVASGQMQFTLSGPQYSNYAVISDDGKYLWNSDMKVYSNSSGTWSLAGTFNTNVSSPNFRNNGSSEVIALSSQILVYDLSTANGGTISPVRSFPIPSYIITKLNQGSGFNWGYDQAAQVIYFETTDSNNLSTLWLYDVDTFAYRGKAKAYLAPNQSQYFPQHIMRNGYQFVSTGFAEKVL